MFVSKQAAVLLSKSAELFYWWRENTGWHAPQYENSFILNDKCIKKKKKRWFRETVCVENVKICKSEVLPWCGSTVCCQLATYILQSKYIGEPLTLASVSNNQTITVLKQDLRKETSCIKVVWNERSFWRYRKFVVREMVMHKLGYSFWWRRVCQKSYGFIKDIFSWRTNHRSKRQIMSEGV